MTDRKPLTLRERARAWWRANGRSFDEALPPGEQGYLAGWHARGRAERVTKARLDRVWIVQSKTFSAVFASNEAADAWVNSRPASIAGGMVVSETPLFHLERAKRRK